ncbi:MAG: hypothetical protein ACYTG6_00090 [Planctomycetota bacterium]|jgi:hypothetical protein
MCSRTRFATSLLLAALLAACGGEEPDGEAVSGGQWRHATLTAVAAPAGVAALEDRLLIVGGADDRRVHVVDRQALAPGTQVASQALPIEVDREAYVGGGDRFATRGYQLGDLWDEPVDFQGVAFQAPNRIFLADRRYRVVYAGRLMEGETGAWRGVRLEHVYSLRGAKRGPTWLDERAGIAGLCAVRGERLTEDLFAVEREGEEPGTFRVYRLDRLGGALGSITVEMEGVGSPGIEGLAREAGGFVILRGVGALVPVPSERWTRRVQAGDETPAPELGGEGRWTGIARGPAGTMFLVGAGEASVVAWRDLD